MEVFGLINYFPTKKNKTKQNQTKKKKEEAEMEIK
jgi:hypothetical protein